MQLPIMLNYTQEAHRQRQKDLLWHLKELYIIDLNLVYAQTEDSPTSKRKQIVPTINPYIKGPNLTWLIIELAFVN